MEMEQGLTNFEEETNLKLYKLEYDGQDVYKLPTFQKWLKRANEFTDTKNKKKNIYGANIYTICFCKKCNGYSVCYFDFEYSCVTCSNCNYFFCSGCSFEGKKEEYHSGSLCLKGFLKLLYIRAIYQKSLLRETYIGYNILFIITSLLFTPLYLGFASFWLGFNTHCKKRKTFFERRVGWLLLFYSSFYGLFMIRHMLLFFPLMIIVLIPSIFNKIYFYSLFGAYLNIFEPNNNGLDI